MKKQTLVFIINPISGLGRQKKIESLVDQVIDKKIFEIKFKYTNAPKDATRIAEECVKENVAFVVAVGGDGTVNEVACALINTDVKLAIIPTGSGNGIARHLKIPMNLTKSLALINFRKKLTIDTAKVNNIPFVMIAGCGFDAFIAHEFSKLKTRGLSGYIKLISKHFFQYKHDNYKLSIDGETIEKEAFLIAVANCSQFGNNAYIAPEAIIDDQLLNVTILKRFPLWSIGNIIIKLFNKKLHLSKYTETYTCKSIKITQNNPISQIDGEPINAGEELNIEICPLSLSVLIP